MSAFLATSVNQLIIPPHHLFSISQIEFREYELGFAGLAQKHE